MNPRLIHASGSAVKGKPYVELGLDSCPNPLKIIDLFAGIGGFHYGIAAAAAPIGRSVKPVFVSELEPTCQATYSKNHKVDVLGDINEINLHDFNSEVDQVDIVTAGFPCQPFSNSGKKLGLSDPRGQFYFRIESIIKHFRAKAFILENVPGMKTNGGGRHNSLLAAEPQIIGSTMRELEENLLNLKDYDVMWFELNSSDFGSPQVRKRVYIVGVHKEFLKRSHFEVELKKYHRHAFKDIAQSGLLPHLHLSNSQERNIRSFMGSVPSYRDGMRRVGKAYLCDGGNVGQAYHAHGLIPTLTKVWARFLPIYFPGEGESRPRLRSIEFEPDHLYRSKSSGTIRRASVKEVMKLQGFPYKFRPHVNDLRAYEHAGNAVNALTVREIAENILRYLK
jgi:DNA-cytosine methyltransferase